MKRLLMLTLLIGLFGHQSIAGADTNKIVLATGEWDPYISESKPGHGKFAEIVTQVFNSMGIKAEFIFTSWVDVEDKVKKGEVFAGMPYSYTKERNNIYDYSVAIMKSGNVFFYNKKAHPNGITYSKLDELSKYKIGGVKGYWYTDLFAQYKLNVDYVKSDEESFTKLYFNQVDLIATDELVGWALIKKLYSNEYSQFDTVARPFETTTLHLLVSRDYPNSAELTQKFNAAYKKMYESEEGQD